MRKTLQDLLSVVSAETTRIDKEVGEDHLLEVRNARTKETTDESDNEGSGNTDFDEGKMREKDDKTSELKQILQSSSVERDPVTDKEGPENGLERGEDLMLAEAIEQDFSSNALPDNNQNPTQMKRKLQQSNEFCDENVKKQKGPRTRSDKLGDLFRYLHLFLKKSNSSDLRVLLDSTDKGKPLVERLKEAVRAINYEELHQPDFSEKKKTALNNELEEQQVDDGLQEARSVGDMLVREIDDAIASDILADENAANAKFKKTDQRIIPNRLHDTVQLWAGSGKEVSTGSASGRLFEKIKEKLESKLMARLNEQPDLNGNTNKSTETSEEITSNIREEFMNRNETSLYYYPVNNERKSRTSTVSADQRNTKPEGEQPRIIRNDTQQTFKKSVINLNNRFKNSFELPNANTIVLGEEKNVKENKNNNNDMIMTINRAVSDVEKILEGAGNEIKHFFSHSQRKP
ncbi:unnamed protein product [Gongylonema pulchrum]|uniref:Uncharacterized protein n=1 Tax=Gongylonema pulchrum TaxID=637853 RepID=A0A183CUI8_9BILA|nr:unnamed protein product [Gongylonema pulchrum]